jgi:hypothetical protein
MTAARLLCLVPFCRRTTRAGRFLEWICPDHWRPIPTRTKALYTRMKRRRPEVAERMWSRLKASCIEIAAGVRR